MVKDKQLVGRYELREVLGTGGMGVVHRAVDARLGREVALKVVDLSCAPQAERARFEREALAAGRLRSAHVVTVHDAGEGMLDGARVGFLVMELLEGAPLNSVLAHGLADVANVVSWGRQILRGLRDAHTAGVVHRDIKPSNVILSSQGVVTLVDFGIAHLSTSNETLTLPGTVVGTPSYMAPEQLRGETADGRSDLYGLGCVLYELLTGQPPFGPGTAWTEGARPAPVRRTRPDVPADLEELVLQLLRADPASRPLAAEAEQRLAALAIRPRSATATEVWNAETQTAMRRPSWIATPPACPTTPAGPRPASDTGLPAATPARPAPATSGAWAATLAGTAGLWAQLSLFTDISGWAVASMAAAAGLGLRMLCVPPAKPDTEPGGNVLAAFTATGIISVYLMWWTPAPWWSVLAAITFLSPALLGGAALIGAITTRLTGHNQTRNEAGTTAGLMNAAVLVVLLGGQIPVAATLALSCAIWLAVTLACTAPIRASSRYVGRHQ
ncbi:serine/threonine protein kinase [Streptomyces sp. NBC_01433]|uniref:serine/threonine-protein kinase n=1 Tax=Streptomyces sp. NBC_01433 TaxID=2903864 RepID=UPI0022502F96|nr:serine/threonine-protein kinase [Streptomyces sp. NBC_01433]MCX4682139.1 serine/threonine protein kinase [Streptomyces sp. NBC_01433]